MRIFLDFTLATAGIAVGTILGLVLASLICIVLKAIWMAIQQVQQEQQGGKR